eukprot:jgi/Mesen1/6024/ME000306S05285
MSLFGLGRNQKTFRPKKNTPQGSKGVALRKHIDATLGSGNLREAVRLPPGEEYLEWLAVNTVDFYNQVNLLYGTLGEFCTPEHCPTMSAGPNALISKLYFLVLSQQPACGGSAVDFYNQVNLLYGTLGEFCTPEHCPTMSAGPKYEYRWADGVHIKKPIEVSAPKYVEYLMDWVESQLDDQTIFPQGLGSSFPSNFEKVVKTIFKRLFRVYAHIYHSHFQKIVALKEEAHLNTCFKHFILYTQEFSLVDHKELAPLEDLIESIT